MYTEEVGCSRTGVPLSCKGGKEGIGETPSNQE